MPFKPGNKANPTGPKPGERRKAKQLRELLIHLVPKSVQVLEELLNDPEYRHLVPKEVFDRVYGKAPQCLEVTGEDGGPVQLIIKDA